jgi:hypothetical protein
MLNLFASLVFNIASLVPVAAPTQCEIVGPRLDGVRVEICNGSAVRYIGPTGVEVTPNKF